MTKNLYLPPDASPERPAAQAKYVAASDRLANVGGEPDLAAYREAERAFGAVLLAEDKIRRPHAYGHVPPANRCAADEKLINDVGTAVMYLTRALREAGLSPAKAIVLDRDTYRRFRTTQLPFDIRGGVPSTTIAGVRLVEES